MVAAVTGSRTWKSPNLLVAVLDSQLARIERLVVGDAKGADRFAALWAKEHGVPYFVYEADWEQHGKAAGMLRNRLMLDDGKPDMLFAFKRGHLSKGTDGCITEAQERNIPVIFVQIPG